MEELAAISFETATAPTISCSLSVANHLRKISTTPKGTMQKITAINEMIVHDHNIIRACSQSYKSAVPNEKQKFANELIRQIAIHSAAEEIAVYPVIESRLVRGQFAADHAREEHSEVKFALHQLDKMKYAKNPGFDDQVDQVMNVLIHHMKDEEEVLLPQLRQSCWEKELVDICDQYTALKGKVPTHPHPYAPDRPPLETIVGMMQAPIDKAYDMVAREFPSRLPPV